MSGNHPQLTHLGTLPVEILHRVVNLLPPLDIKSLSCASKWLREVCLPSVFRRVRFRFALAGFDGLKGVLKSDIRRCVVSFTYVVPELLKTGKHPRPEFILTTLKFSAELLDFDRFKSDILTPDRYLNLTKNLYDADSGDYECPSYMAMYKAVHSICREQRSIIDKGADLVLSSAFGTLPQLKEESLSFSEVLEKYNWVPQSLASGMIIKEEF
jgi:hypothetical protein